MIIKDTPHKAIHQRFKNVIVKKVDPSILFDGPKIIYQINEDGDRNYSPSSRRSR